MSTKAAKRKLPTPLHVHNKPVAVSAGNLFQAIRAGQVSIDDLIKHADEFGKAGNTQTIDQLYTEWLAHNQHPLKFVAHFNYGVLLANWGRVADSINQYEQAIQLRPGFPQALINLGLAKERDGKNEEAFRHWNTVVADTPDNDPLAVDMKTTALNHIGRVHEILRNYDQAEAALEKSLLLKPNQGDCIHHWFHLRQKQCKWPILEQIPGMVTANQVLKHMSPLASLAHADDPGLQMFVGEKIVREKFTFPVTPLTATGSRYGHDRIRIGYLSGDLCTHAVGLIVPEIFELHDRSKFEIFAYDYSKEDGSQLRQRFKTNIENFTSIAGLSDEQAAIRIRADEIDILIDLHGLSLGLRAAILAQRPAPIQMTYLGYIGTTMMPYIDYVITDKYCLPEELLPYYSEKPLFLDHCCLPTDRKKHVEPTPDREAVGLPRDKFIYATFNNSYKLNQSHFSTWVRILKRVENSVLWIVDDNPWATQNLKNFVASHSVSPERLVFTPRVPPSQYLARMPLADVFLDNHPYNAGSTASDILWMGVPMVTLSGRTFVSRMAGSMLHHAGVPELIASTPAHYEEIAVALSSLPQKLQEIRGRLLAQRQPGGSFDMGLFTRSLEQQLMIAYRNS